MTLVRVEVHLFLWVFSKNTYLLICHFSMEVRHQCNFLKRLLGVLLLQPLPFYAQETQHPACYLLGFQYQVFISGIVFPLLSCAKTLIWLFWPYSRAGACWTVLVVPDLCALLQQRTCWKPTGNQLILLKMRFGQYLYHIPLCRNLKDLEILHYPVSGTLVKKLVHKYPGTNNLIMINLAECGGNCSGRPRRFSIMGCYKLAIQLSMYSN